MSNPADRKRIEEKAKEQQIDDSDKQQPPAKEDDAEDMSESLDSVEWPPRFFKFLCRFDDDTELAFLDARRLGRLFIIQDDPLQFGPIAKLGTFNSHSGLTYL